MSMIDRAAQFAPFAALTGYEASLAETADACGYSDASTMLHAISSESKKGNLF